MSVNKIAVIGAGNMGGAIVKGIINSGYLAASSICVADPRKETREFFENLGTKTTDNNIEAVSWADLVVFAIKPYHIEIVMNEVKQVLSSDKMLVSIVAGISLEQLTNYSGLENPDIYRVIPNTAISIQESMTCIVANSDKNLAVVQELFNHLGKTIVINEDLMAAATALASCGTAFALRYVRASMQGGIEMGFSAETAQFITSQTVLGAVKLLLESGSHPEVEIDKVTTPKGLTITGINEMEHMGFSFAVIKGLVSSFNKMG